MSQSRKHSAIEAITIKDHAGANNPNWKGGKIIRKCLKCGVDFGVKRHVIKDGGGKFCSQSCRASITLTGDKAPNWKGGGVICKCEICQKEFTIKKSETYRGKFCSRKCHGNWKSQYKTGINNHSWKGGITPERQVFNKSVDWKNAVSAVWKRDKATCQNCLKKQIYKEKSFEVHHIISFKYKELRAAIDNLVLLCNPCHGFIHSKKNLDRRFIKNAPV